MSEFATNSVFTGKTLSGLKINWLSFTTNSSIKLDSRRLFTFTKFQILTAGFLTNLGMVLSLRYLYLLKDAVDNLMLVNLIKSKMQSSPIIRKTMKNLPNSAL